ncbi:endophilin-B1 isoform X2 [Patella vulgata]|uniref:endophilin-B1 isoform X2 n=1 Tax=Patella vulgata TaxID=6465 RepID=UPI0021807956|nr:endophilin-B1 isoform X2 [Patella vulgata]
MDMKSKLNKFAGGAGTLFNRAVQFTEEKLGSAEKTELDAHFENLLQRAEKTRIWTERVLKQTEAVLQPNPNQRMEDLLYEKLEKKKKDRVTNAEQLGLYMVDSGNDFGPGTSYGNALIKCGQAEIKIGTAEREFVTQSVNNFLQPLRNFLEGDMKTIMKEKRLLEVKRLDLDAAKSRLRKAKSPNAQQQGEESKRSPEEDDAVAKAEADLRAAQTEFDRQAEITKILLEGINSTHAHHLRCLNDFIEAQMTYYAQCQQHMVDLQRQLGSYSVGSNVGGGNLPNMHQSSSAFTNNINPLEPSAPPAIQVTAATPTEKKQARVLYDYEAANSSELSLLADELIMVYSVAGLDPDWLMAEKKNTHGVVPLTYLEILE